MAILPRARASEPRGNAASRRAISRSVTDSTSWAASCRPGLSATTARKKSRRCRSVFGIARGKLSLGEKRSDFDSLLGFLGVDDDRFVRLNVDQFVPDLRLGRQ